MLRGLVAREVDRALYSYPSRSWRRDKDYSSLCSCTQKLVGSFRTRSLAVRARNAGPAPGGVFRPGGGPSSASRQRTKPPQKGGPTEAAPTMNESIRAPNLRLLGEDQSMLGVMSRDEALAAAQHAGLDLVLIAADADPPVARIMDYSKFRYEQQRKKRDQQRKVAANRQEIKELKMRYNIDIGDYNVRLKQALKFLKDGDKVKVSAQFRGREMEFKELGLQLFERFARDVTEVGIVETKAAMEGRTMQMVLIPNKVALAKAAAAERKQQQQQQQQQRQQQQQQERREDAQERGEEPLGADLLPLSGAGAHHNESGSEGGSGEQGNGSTWRSRGAEPVVSGEGKGEDPEDETDEAFELEVGSFSSAGAVQPGTAAPAVSAPQSG